MKKKSKARRLTNDAGRNVGRKLTLDEFVNPLARSGAGMPNLLEATEYPLTRFTQNWQVLNSLYRSHWVVQKIINTIPQDMMKNGYDFQSDINPDQIQKISKVIRQTRLHSKILNGLYWGRLYGGAAGIIMIDGEADRMDEPLDLDRVMPGAFKGLLIMDRWSGIIPSADLITDITDPDFGMPEYYEVTLSEGQGVIQLHNSRVCRFSGREMPYLEKLAENYWGTSEMEHVFSELKKRDNVSWNIALLTFMANIRVMKIDGMEQLLAYGGDKSQQALYNTLEGLNMMLNNNGIQILGKDDSYESHQYTFSGLGEVYDRFMMDVSGACGIPVTKLFGRSPAGMNSTGDADMDNYYDTIEQSQESQLRPVLDKLLPIVCMSALGAVPDDLDYIFNPVRRPSNDEKQSLGSQQTAAVVQAYTAGLVSEKTALRELQGSSKLTGMWTNITDKQIEAASDQPEAAGEMNIPGMSSMETQDADFEESKHPRSNDGKFTGGGSGGGNSIGFKQESLDLLGQEHKAPHGDAAVQKLLDCKNGHIKNAFIRSDIDDITLIWGNDAVGLKHIIKRRKEENEDVDELVSHLSDTIENGTLKINKRGRFVITKGKYQAIISPEIFNDKLNFLVTGYFVYDKKDQGSHEDD
jgi:phage-related protein (TIGR01555 family)